MSISLGYASTRDGGRVFYATEGGDGVPLVFADAPWYWPVPAQLKTPTDMAFTRAFANGRPWMMFDWRGRGQSSDPPGPLALDTFVDDLEAIVRALGRPFDLYAFLQGCPIATTFAARYPHRVERLVLKEPLRVERDRQTLPYREMFADGDVESLKVLFRSWQDDPVDDDLATEIATLWAPNATRAFVGAARHAVWDIDLVEVGRQVEAPVLLCERESRIAPVLAMAKEWPEAQVGVEPVARNGKALGGAMAAMLEEHLPPPRQRLQAVGSARAEPLSRRELEVLALLADGASNAGIAARLVISPNTAAGHVASILAKLGLHSRAQAAAYAHRHGLAGPSPAPHSDHVRKVVKR